jgi:large conductance mechanosensitive channel
LIDFLIIALSIFLVIKALNSFKKKEEQVDVPAAPPKQELLLEEIRDLLKKH